MFRKEQVQGHILFKWVIFRKGRDFRPYATVKQQ